MAGLRAVDEDPSATYFQVYSTYKQGEELERGGNFDAALQKYRFCVSVLQQMQQRNPNYQPSIVEFRLKKSRSAIARLQSIQNLPQGIDPVPAPTKPAASAPSIFAPARPYRLPAPAESQPTQTSPAADFDGGAATHTALGALRDQIRALRAQLDQQTRINEDLNNRLLQSTAQVLSGQKEVDLWRVKVVELQSQLSQSRQSNDDLQQAVDHLTKEKAFDDRRIASLESELSDARADLEVADEHAGELFARLEQAAKFIEADEKIRLQLVDERKTLAARAAEKSAGVAQMKKERDAALAERDALRRRVDDAAAMAKENKTLTAKLAAAEKQIASLAKDDDQRGKVEQDLRRQIDEAGKKLVAMREQLDSGQKKIAELEKQLADTASATALATGAMAEENALLKSIVLRELQEQARRQQARKLLEEELEKLQVKSTTLLDQLGNLAAAEPTLNAREKKVVGVPAGALAAAPSDFTIVKPMPESDLPADLVARADEANKLSQNRKFEEARTIYEEIARKAPQSYLAAVNLGIAQRQLGNYEQAIVAFRRALELKDGDPFALTNLGTAEYRAGNLTEAVKILQKAVEVDEESYLAHYILGMALNDKGDREGAREEVRKTLAIKPDYIPAMELAGDLEGDFGAASAEKSTPQAAQ